MVCCIIKKKWKPNNTDYVFACCRILVKYLLTAHISRYVKPASHLLNVSVIDSDTSWWHNLMSLVQESGARGNILSVALKTSFTLRWRQIYTRAMRACQMRLGGRDDVMTICLKPSSFNPSSVWVMLVSMRAKFNKEAHLNEHYISPPQYRLN